LDYLPPIRFLGEVSLDGQNFARAFPGYLSQSVDAPSSKSEASPSLGKALSQSFPDARTGPGHDHDFTFEVDYRKKPPFLREMNQLSVTYQKECFHVKKKVPKFIFTVV
jgi:hypothetical protein